MVIPKEIFRAYDIRGRVDTQLTPTLMKWIGQAVGTLVLSLNEKSLVLARDGRLSGPRLLSAMKEGVLSTGCDVVDIGLVPTPALYFATHHLRLPSGCVITGSHNPKDFNGIKIVLGGHAIHSEEVQAIYQRILKQDFVVGSGQTQDYNIESDYIQFIVKEVNLKKRLKIVVDCGNGAAGILAPRLYKALGCEVIPLYCDIDGHFPNHHPDPGQPANLNDLITQVQATKADIGLAFDGDGDRLGVVDSNGKIIWPDRLLPLFAREILERKPGSEFIFDVKCSRHVAREITELGGLARMWKTGHSLIKAKMKETGAPLAGEMSGHIFFQDRWLGFDDGLYSGARLLEILANTKTTSASLFATVPESISTPEILVRIAEEEKIPLMKALISEAKFEDANISTIDGLRADFDDGFGLIRPSNTGPNLIFRFEGDTQAALLAIQDKFRVLLAQVAPTLTFPV